MGLSIGRFIRSNAEDRIMENQGDPDENGERQGIRRINLSSLFNDDDSDDNDSPIQFTQVLAWLQQSVSIQLQTLNGRGGLDYDDDDNGREKCPPPLCSVSTAKHSSAYKNKHSWKNLAFEQGQRTAEKINFEPDQNKCVHGKNLTICIRERQSLCNRKRKFSTFGDSAQTSISSRFIPNCFQHCIPFSEKVFCGSYSADGSTFLSACQDRNLRVFETQNGFKQPYKVVQAKDVGWSVLDTAFQHDSRFVAYSSWSNYVHLCSVFDRGDPKLAQHYALDLRPDNHHLAIFSLKFSSDSQEIICGANDGYIYVYNTERMDRTVKIDAHEDDINAVCFADPSSQILYSGGDDGLVKVWDRRTFSESNTQPAGVFAGHQDGITFIDSRGDARYLISNSKDQSIKLWDVRQFSGRSAVDNVRRIVSGQSWDYRWQAAPRKLQRHDRSVQGDTSVQTYVGHKVLNTLIRARFSPQHSTGSKYIYCGCSSGRIYIYDTLTAEVISKRKKHTGCVRDVDWHPYNQQMVSSSWDGSLVVWTWKGENSLAET